MNKTTEAFEAWWADTGEQSLFALNTTTDDDIKILAGITWEAAIREALAEQEKQEPVAWMWQSVDIESRRIETGLLFNRGADDENTDWTPLYAAPVDAKAIRAEAFNDGVLEGRNIQAFKDHADMQQDAIDYEDWKFNPMTGKPIWGEEAEPVKQEPVCKTCESLARTVMMDQTGKA